MTEPNIKIDLGKDHQNVEMQGNPIELMSLFIGLFYKQKEVFALVQSAIKGYELMHNAGAFAAMDRATKAQKEKTTKTDKKDE